MMTRWTDRITKDNVISLTRLASRNDSPSQLRQIEAYWSALCHDGDVPQRAAVDPRGLENLLEHAFVLERVAPGIARFRVAGQHLVEHAGMDVRGMPVSALFSAHARAGLSAALEHVFEKPAIAELSLGGESGFGRKQIQGKMLVLPLRDESGRISRALGALVIQSRKRAPQRFYITEAQFSNATAPEDPVCETPEPVRSFAEPATKFDGKAPHLRLVSSQD